MPLPYPKAEANSRDRAKHLLKGYASGGGVDTKVRTGVGAHERRMHPGKSTTKIDFGSASGSKTANRMDRAPRAKGGRTKATKVNVIVNAGGADPTQAMGAPGAPPLSPPIPPVAPPVAPAMPPRPMGPPMGGAPGMPPGLPMRARGGKVYDAGAGTGDGRLEKVAAYGANAKIKDTTKAVKGP